MDGPQYLRLGRLGVEIKQVMIGGGCAGESGWRRWGQLVEDGDSGYFPIFFFTSRWVGPTPNVSRA
jgi:hypothetical protein